MYTCTHVLFQKPKSLKCMHQWNQWELDRFKVKKKQNTTNLTSWFKFFYQITTLTLTFKTILSYQLWYIWFIKILGNVYLTRCGITSLIYFGSSRGYFYQNCTGTCLPNLENLTFSLPLFYPIHSIFQLRLLRFWWKPIPIPNFVK